MYPGLRYAPIKKNFACQKKNFGKCLFEYKDRFAVEKKSFAAISKLLGKFFVVAIKKNPSHTISIYKIV